MKSCSVSEVTLRVLGNSQFQFADPQFSPSLFRLTRNTERSKNDPFFSELLKRNHVGIIRSGFLRFSPSRSRGRTVIRFRGSVFTIKGEPTHTTAALFPTRAPTLLARLVGHQKSTRPRISNLERPGSASASTMRIDGSVIFGVLTYCRAFFVSRHRLGLEIAAVRQQLVVFKRKQPRPRLCVLDRAFWVTLRRVWQGWASARIIVKPDRRGLAPCWLSSILAITIQRSPPGPADRKHGGSVVDSAHEVRKPILGRLSHPRRATSTRI